MWIADLRGWAVPRQRASWWRREWLALLSLAAALTIVPAAEAQQHQDSGLPPIARDSLVAGGLTRTFDYYEPDEFGFRPGLVIALHGAGGRGARFRAFTGAALERLAAEHGFVVVYADGIGGSWNDCRSGAPYEAKRRGIDDVGFLRAIIQRFHRSHGVDTSAVLALGYSNGGHLAYRVALEAPSLVRAAVVFGANLPIDDELDCTPSGRAASVMIVNGTTDRINPYDGGLVVGPTGDRLGHVRSATESAAYFVELAGYRGAPRETAIVPDDKGHAVTRAAWTTTSIAVVLYTIAGGGHAVPGQDSHFPALVGTVERRFDALAEAVRVFLPAPPSLDADAAPASPGGQSPSGMTAQRMR